VIIKFKHALALSLNKYIRMNPFARARLQAQVNEDVGWEIRVWLNQHKLFGPVPQYPRARIKYTIHSPERWEMDAENEVAISKILTDAIKYTRLIPDDKKKYVGRPEICFVPDEDRYVDVEIEVIDSEGGM